ncbi:putative disease resistance RPP13-like protein 1 isoform X1 [Ziziphus jujuba]|uniref:Disease resistance RPP13-like protein 1 isoform X1 n=2 Tax=Ziziphus jujuba TaxID=326968 RepID=A0A6P4A5W2_ZIZJJ|nr:putative disease resistance RPP13-like protein 1 isoform X1 [Ziziphus jujuba]
MAELIAEAFFTAYFEQFLNMILSGEVLKFVSGKKLDDGMLKKFKTMLLSVKASLNDAEKKQISDPDVRQWLDELKDTMYHAEDLAYEIETEALRCKIRGGQSGSRIFQVLNFSSRFNIKNLEDRIVEILHTLEAIVNQKVHLGSSVSECSDHQNKSSSYSPPLLPVEEESDIYGRDDDKAVIVKLLLSDDDHVVGSNNISVIPIVGMGGIGKTTLARLVYNDVNVMKNFDLQAWITVSNEFDVFTLTKTIFERITEQKDCCIKHPDQLQSELKKVVEGKKFLLVLDDVWNENYNLWDNLKSQFTLGALGSKIIVTTRIGGIGYMMGTVQNYCLEKISDKDSWQLFAKHAFRKINPSGIQDFEEIGRGIVKKCNGLPLAIKSLAGLLCSKNHIDEWEDILHSDTWKLPKEKCDILPALWLSYYYLPPHLKRCFAYCSIFPKDYEFEKEKLIMLWMAEDLLRPQQNKMPEEIGEEYFNDLTSRSFFHCSDNGFIMHDLVNDLASFVSGEFCLRFDDAYSKVFTGKTRYLSCITSESHDIKKLEEYLSKNKVFRTLLFQSNCSKQFLTNFEQLKPMRCLRALSLYGSVITTGLDLIGSLKLLRYLDLSFTQIEELPNAICTLYNLQTLLLHLCIKLSMLPNSIGNLKRLRYLGLSYCFRLKKIPDTLCDLHDLHTLNLSSCGYLSRLPTDMSRLVNLRYLGFSYTGVTEMPQQMCKLKHLQYLKPALLVDKNGGRNIKDLGNLEDLRGSLKIKNLENIVNVKDVLEAKLANKKHITELVLEWCGETDDSEKVREVLDRLQPHTNVQQLTLFCYQGTRFPSWIGHHSFRHMVSLRLNDCRNCCWLPQLGQLPSLKDLHINIFDMVERIGDEFYYCSSSTSSSSSSSSSSSMITPPFKSLNFLHLYKFRELREWKDWSLMGREGSEGGAFPQLKTLILEACPKIKVESLPHFPSSTTLVIEKCQQLVASLQSHQLPWLRSLELRSCSELVTFPSQSGLPSNIHTLKIDRCGKLESLAKEGWPSNLKSLEIYRCRNLFVDVQCSFPEEGLLPTTLTCIKLDYVPNLKSLNGKALQDLVCLEKLTIKECYKLQCLPEEGLPDSLSELNIIRCHTSLADRCQRDTGEDWLKIARIPRINIACAKKVKLMWKLPTSPVFLPCIPLAVDAPRISV